MAVDIGVEIVQLMAASREINNLLRRKLLQREGGQSIESTGLRAGLDHQIAGLLQMLRISQSYTLEIAIKALFKDLNPGINPQGTHDLLDLFNSLNRNVKNKLRAKWLKASGRSEFAQSLTLDDFLETYRSIFEDSRYLYEESPSYKMNTNDFNVSTWVFVEELTRQNKMILYNLLNILEQEQGGGLLKSIFKSVD